jgi:hypothetical protein
VFVLSEVFDEGERIHSMFGGCSTIYLKVRTRLPADLTYKRTVVKYRQLWHPQPDVC